jgi:hypothetical protein
MTRLNAPGVKLNVSGKQEPPAPVHGRPLAAC